MVKHTKDFSYPIGAFGKKKCDEVASQTGVTFTPFNPRNRYSGFQTISFTAPTIQALDNATDLLDAAVVKYNRYQAYSQRMKIAGALHATPQKKPYTNHQENFPPLSASPVQQKTTPKKESQSTPPVKKNKNRFAPLLNEQTEDQHERKPTKSWKKVDISHMVLDYKSSKELKETVHPSLPAYPQMPPNFMPDPPKVENFTSTSTTVLPTLDPLPSPFDYMQMVHPIPTDETEDFITDELEKYYATGLATAGEDEIQQEGEFWEFEDSFLVPEIVQTGYLEHIAYSNPDLLPDGYIMANGELCMLESEVHLQNEIDSRIHQANLFSAQKWNAFISV